MRALRHRLQFTLYAGVRALIRALPHAASAPLGRALGALAYRLDRKDRRTALDNLARALPELDAAERRRLARRSFRAVAAATVETLSASRFPPEQMRRRLDIEGFEHLEAAQAGGRGVLLLTGHLGCFEFAAYAVALKTGSCQVLSHRLSNPLFDRELRRVRQRYGITILDSSGAARRMYKILKRGGRIGIALDQRTRPQEAIEVPFFGRPSLTSPVPAQLSLLTGAPVVPIFVLPAPGGRFRVIVEPPIEPCGEADDKQAIATLTATYLAAIERRIRRAPEQWIWFYRRWRQADLESPLRSSLALRETSPAVRHPAL